MINIVTCKPFLGNELANTLPRRYDSFGNQSVATNLTHVSMEKWRWIPRDHVSTERPSVSMKTQQRFRGYEQKPTFSMVTARSSFTIGHS
jgi:hypothetical protein